MNGVRTGAQVLRDIKMAAALSDLTTGRRLCANMDARAVTRRLQTVEALGRMCLRLGRGRK